MGGFFFAAEHGWRRILCDFPERHANVGPRAGFGIPWLSREGARRRLYRRRRPGRKKRCGFSSDAPEKVGADGNCSCCYVWREADGYQRVRSQHRRYPYWYEGFLSQPAGRGCGGKYPCVLPSIGECCVFSAQQLHALLAALDGDIAQARNAPCATPRSVQRTTPGRWTGSLPTCSREQPAVARERAKQIAGAHLGLFCLPHQ